MAQLTGAGHVTTDPVAVALSLFADGVHATRTAERKQRELGRALVQLSPEDWERYRRESVALYARIERVPA